MTNIKKYTNLIGFMDGVNNTKNNSLYAKRKKYSNFQKSKYLSMIAGSESQIQVRNIKSMLQKEACKAENCEDSKEALEKIRSTMQKASDKISSLKLEQNFKAKNEKLKALRRHKKETLKNETKLRNKKLKRKTKELNDVVNALKEEKNGNNITGNYNNSEAVKGQNLNVVVGHDISDNIQEENMKAEDIANTSGEAAAQDIDTIV